jgi:hypothetical protein
MLEIDRKLYKIKKASVSIKPPETFIQAPSGLDWSWLSPAESDGF